MKNVKHIKETPVPTTKGLTSRALIFTPTSSTPKPIALTPSAPAATTPQSALPAKRHQQKSKDSSKHSDKENIRRSTPLKSANYKLRTTRMQHSASKEGIDLCQTLGDKVLKATKVPSYLTQLKEERTLLEKQISELTRTSELKTTEIATLKMEVNRLKEQLGNGGTYLKEELCTLQTENKFLRERLEEMGFSSKNAAISDTEKEILQRSSSELSLASAKKEQVLNLLGSLEGNSRGDVDLAPAATGSVDWEKGSSGGGSEISVACLQDRIQQMEETHYSTSEELQATLQELADLQDQLTELHTENERLHDEKAVLLESLCSQTEKLEECRSRISSLKALFFNQYNIASDPSSHLHSHECLDGPEGFVPLATTISEREEHLVSLLKSAEEENERLVGRSEELQAAVRSAQEEAAQERKKAEAAAERARLLQSTVDSVQADKRLLETQLLEIQEAHSAAQVKISQLKLQLQTQQQKVSGLQRERDQAGTTTELDKLLRQAQTDKEHLEASCLRLQEQEALAQREAERLRDQVAHLQEENMVAKNNCHKQVSDLEYRLEQVGAERALLEAALESAESRCQSHLEDKRQLKATVGELQAEASELRAKKEELAAKLAEAAAKHQADIEDWHRFQADLLVTVRVANDFKTEAQQDNECLKQENKNLLDKVDVLEKQIEQIKAKCETPSILNSSRTPSSSDTPLRRTSKRPTDYRSGPTQSSVRSLIESIENATKQAKGPCCSRSSSTSSVNSVSSDSRATSNAHSNLLFGNGSTSSIFIKPPLRATVSDISNHRSAGNESRGGTPSIAELASNGIPGKCHVGAAGDHLTSTGSKCEADSVSHKVPMASILASKIEPLRRNSYAYDLTGDKKDPLAALTKGGGSKRNALLKWCQNKTVGYKGIDITNFSSSWNDGLALCALLHSYLPRMIPYSELDSKNKRHNFTLAFKAAESVGIPTTLNINDMICQERPDWQSVMTYVTSIYKHFET